ncbi:hypothetical protein [Pantoea stewartii]|uniref:hypothetical protein n=1 Tax=Pantoea stewartii TaxID=66269 RepID=UPI0025A292B7|nr:hypothetical protein [Pantoea stewartii]
MTSALMKNLQNGYAEKVEADRIEGVKERAHRLYHGYVSAKKAFSEPEIEFQPNGDAYLYCDKWHLTGMTSLKSFKQTGWYYYNHYSGRMGLFITSVIGDRCFIRIPIKRTSREGLNEC